MAKKPLVSVVVTTKNEASHISSLLDSLLNQTLRPARIIVVDSCSNDGTGEIIQQYCDTHPQISLITAPGNRSTGRNIGISHAPTQLVAITDAGCLPDPNWLKELVSSAVKFAAPVVAGYYRGAPANLFQQALIPYVLVMPDRASADFLASTRSMLIRKDVWCASGGFDQRVDPSEDYEYSLRLRKMGYQSVFNPQALVIWRPNRNFFQAMKMFYQFALSDSRWRLPRPKVKLIFIRYIAGVVIAVAFLPAAAAAIFLYAAWSVLKSVKYLPHTRAAVWLPFIQIGSDLAVMAGTIHGLIRRIYPVNAQ